MSAINMNRVIVGGLAAGLVINVSEYILNEPVLGEQMAASLSRMNLPPIGGSAIAMFILLGFVVGIVLVWLYAAIRSRFGAGPKTAVIAAVLVWFLAYLYPSLGMAALGIFETGLLVIAMVWGLIELIVAALIGAKLYSEA